MTDLVLRPFVRADLDHYRDKAIEAGVAKWFERADGVTGMTGEVDGVPVGSGGLVDHGDGKAFAWAVLTRLPRKHVLAVHRAYRDEMDRSGYSSIETHVQVDFMSSHRWVQLMGFAMDREFPTLFADGLVFVRYQRVMQ